MVRPARFVPPFPVLAALALSGCYSADEVLSRPDLEPLEALASGGHELTNTEIPGALDGYNDPSQLIPDVQMRFDALPLAGRLDREPWSDTYWPENEGGITHRWQTGEQHTYRFWTKEEALQATPEQVAKLSPSEKYDLFAGNYAFPLSERERSSNSPDEAAWTGYCHGWAPASMQYDEPHPVTVTNPDGIDVAFGSADLKALLTYYVGVVLPSSYGAGSLPFRTGAVGIGTRCGNNRVDNPACHDTNPGALHVVMANRLGLQGQGLVLDVDAGYQTWNQPLYSYRSEILTTRAPSAGAAETAVREHILASELTWGMEIQPMWEPVLGTPHQELKTVELLYTVELDAAGEVVGGQWVFDDGNGLWTLGQVWDFLADFDRDGDSAPDLTVDERSALVGEWFTMIDFAWIIEERDFPPAFEDVSSPWALIGGGVTSRRELYAYMGRLSELVD